MKWLIGLVVLAVGTLGVGAIALVLVFASVIPVNSETRTLPFTGHLVPSDFTAEAVADQLAVQLTWTALSKETADYVLMRSERGDRGPWREVAILEVGSSAYLDQDVRGGVDYLYRIEASDPDGSAGLSNVASARASRP